MEERDEYQKLKDQINTDEQKEWLESLKEEEFEEAFDFRKNEIKESLEDDGFHMEMIQSVAAAFLKGSDISEETGYNFLFTEPLVEKGEKNFDVLIYNTESNSAVFVECKSSISDRSMNGVLEDTEQAIEAVEEHEEYLERQIGDDIDHKGFVLMTSASDIQKLKDRDWEFNGGDDTCLWYIDIFKQKKILLERSKGSHNHKKLAEKMKNGIVVDDRRIDIKLIYNTNNYRAIKKVLIDILRDNQKMEREDPKEFDKERLAETLTDMVKMGTSDVDELMVEKAENLEEIAKKCEVIKEGNELDYRIVSSYSKVKGIRKDIESKLINNIASERAEEDARERAVERFKKGEGSGQQGLDSFN
ncbi:MAG: hypothetical protein ABEJ07_03845 [Candidatus Nanohaloarchaea archaeon]